MQKNFLTSKTIWGLIITVLGIFGLGDVLPADFGEKAINATNAVLEIGGILIAAYGRFKADKALKILPK